MSCLIDFIDTSTVRNVLRTAKLISLFLKTNKKEIVLLFLLG